jgi:hypothetical protein
MAAKTAVLQSQLADVLVPNDPNDRPASTNFRVTWAKQHAATVSVVARNAVYDAARRRPT